MKMFKRLVAVLLAGVMALAMLTACGNEAKTDIQLAEDTYLAIYNGVFGTECQNDSALQAAARKVLTEKVAEDGTVTGGSMQISDDGMTAVFIMSEDGTTAQAQQRETLEALSDPAALNAAIAATKEAAIKSVASMPGMTQEDAENFLQQAASMIQSMGTGAVEKDGNVYVAVAIRLKSDAQD